MFLRKGRLRVKNRNFINAKCNELWRWRILEMEEKVKEILNIQISKKRKMSMTSNNIQEFRNTTKRIHKIKENIEIHVKD